VVFGQVADPFRTQIAESFERNGRANVAGTFNRAPEAVNVEVIRQYDLDFDTLSLLYNANEENSRIKRDDIYSLAPQLDVRLVAIEIDPGNAGMPDSTLIPVRMAELRAAGVDWLYVGSLPSPPRRWRTASWSSALTKTLCARTRRCSRSRREARTSGG
jgi:putative ABC transport system substrate-binding protein